MTNEARIARNVYMKAWRAKNKERIKHHTQAYWERKAQTQQKEAAK